MQLVLVEWTHNGATVFTAGWELKTDSPGDTVEVLQSCYLDGKPYYLPLSIPAVAIMRKMPLESGDAEVGNW